MSKRWYVFKILLLSYRVYCDDCLTYDFEKDYGIIFNQNSNMCVGRLEWRVGNYSDIDVSSPHGRSTKFVYPGEGLSCVSSVPYPMSGGGTFEVTVYLEPKIGDEIWMLVNEIVPNGQDAAVGNMWFTESGWHTRRISLTGRGQYQGYITMLGIAEADSIVLVDSFRYIPPNYEGDCNIYEHEITTTDNPTNTTTSEDMSTTPGITTTEEWTTTPEITTTREWTTTPEITTTEESTTTPGITITEQWTTTPEITTTEESTTTPGITTTEEWTTTPEITTTGQWTTTPEITTTEESTTTPGITTTGQWTTTPEITTTREWTTTPEITTTGESTTTQDITTTEETTTTPAITTTDQFTTTEDFISVETTPYTTMESTTSEITSTTNDETTTPTSDISTNLPEKTTTQQITKPEDTDPTLNPNEPTQNTEITTESTIPPTSRPVLPDSYSFWNPYTITMLIFLIFIFIVTVAGVSYYYGMRKGRMKEPIIISDFIDELPKSIIIPRVDKINNNSILTRLG